MPTNNVHIAIQLQPKVDVDLLADAVLATLLELLAPKTAEDEPA